MFPLEYIYIFLWLVSHNKIMTRDNLKRRHLNKPEDCAFCSQLENVHHLLFDFVVASNTWELLSGFYGFQIGKDYESVARFWVSNKKNSALNSITSDALWCIWKSRNAIVFNNSLWTNNKQVWSLLSRTAKNWSILSQGPALEKILDFCQFLSKKIKAPLPICG